MSDSAPNTGLEYEGEAARQRFIVYWVRPAIAALFVGVFTFFVVSVPGEKEKIKLRGERQAASQQIEQLQRQVDFAEPLARMASVESLVMRDAGTADGPWARLLFSQQSGRAILLVTRLQAEEGDRGFVWLRRDGERQLLSAIDLQKGAGRAEFQLGSLGGSLELTAGVEAAMDEPADEKPAQLVLDTE